MEGGGGGGGGGANFGMSNFGMTVHHSFIVINKEAETKKRYTERDLATTQAMPFLEVYRDQNVSRQRLTHARTHTDTC